VIHNDTRSTKYQINFYFRSVARFLGTSTRVISTTTERKYSLSCAKIRDTSQILKRTQISTKLEVKVGSTGEKSCMSLSKEWLRQCRCAKTDTKSIHLLFDISCTKLFANRKKNLVYSAKFTGRNSAVGVATRYGRHGQNGPRKEVRFFRTHPGALGPTQLPLQWVPGLFPRVKAAGAWRG
jgi:hypothetical protein